MDSLLLQILCPQLVYACKHVATTVGILWAVDLLAVRQQIIAHQ